MKIVIETIAHSDQRYPTAGDWYYDDSGNLTIRVSQLGDWRYEALVGLHELVEVLKCKHDGVTQEEVDHFDRAYEVNRREGDESEPGDSIRAPYRKQHCLATGIERIMCSELGVSWQEYEEAIQALP
jgi:hypothetical protein